MRTCFCTAATVVQLLVNSLPPNNPEIHQNGNAQSNSDNRTGLRHPIRRRRGVSTIHRFRWQVVFFERMDGGADIGVDDHLEKRERRTGGVCLERQRGRRSEEAVHDIIRIRR